MKCKLLQKSGLQQQSLQNNFYTYFALTKFHHRDRPYDINGSIVNNEWFYVSFRFENITIKSYTVQPLLKIN